MKVKKKNESKEKWGRKGKWEKDTAGSKKFRFTFCKFVFVCQPKAFLGGEILT